MRADNCPFCAQITSGAVRWATPDARVLTDRYPSALGHLLVVPALHGDDLFALPPYVREQMWYLVDVARDSLAALYRPDGFTIGANVGVAAGQTVPHAHLHVIPRYAGDTSDPRGGIRRAIPETAVYWTDDSSTSSDLTQNMTR